MAPAPAGIAIDVSVLAKIKETNTRMLSVCSLVPLSQWGFEESIHEKLRQRKHRLVNQQLTKGEKSAMSKASKQKMARGLGGVCDTVGDVLEWMKSSIISAELRPTKKKTEAELKKEAKAKAAKAKDQKKNDSENKLQKDDVAEKRKFIDAKKVAPDEEQYSSSDESVSEEVPAKKDRFSIGSLNRPVDEEESDNSDVPMDVEEEPKIQKKRAVDLPKAINVAAKKQKRKADGDDATEQKIRKLDPVDFSRVDPLDARRIAMERLKQKIELMKGSRRGKKTPEQFEEERKAKRRMSKMKLKQRKTEAKKDEKENSSNTNGANASSAKKESNGVKDGGSEEVLKTDEGNIVYSKFDYIVREDPKKQSKKEKRDKFTGKDYNRLIDKAEKRQERIEKLKTVNPEKAEKIEESIKWNKALGMAEGQKIKDNVELLKKGAKRKEKTKERSKHKWGARKRTVDREQKQRLDKREANIAKRKEDKQKKKLERLRKKGRNV